VTEITAGLKKKKWQSINQSGDNHNNLMAQALAHGHILVTHEIASSSTKKIKIPDACIGLGIKCMTPFAMLQREQARFVLSTQK
jgi:hypothetical protein